MDTNTTSYSNSAPEKKRFNAKTAVTALKWIVIIAVIVSFGQVIAALFSSASDLVDQMVDALGVGVKLLKGITSGCNKQTNCENIKTEKACKGNDDCKWDDDACLIYDPDKKANDGGFFSVSCGLMWFTLGGILYPLLSFLVRRILSKSGTPEAKTIDILARLSSKSADQIQKDMITDFDNTTREEKKLEDNVEKADGETAKESANAEMIDFYEKRYGDEAVKQMLKNKDGGFKVDDDGRLDLKDANFKEFKSVMKDAKFDMHKNTTEQLQAEESKVTTIAKDQKTSMIENANKSKEVARDKAKSQEVKDAVDNAFDKKVTEPIEKFGPVP
jgi:hypothetical protein